MTAEFFLSRFTPSMMSADVLEKVFVQRGDMAERIVEVLRESILTPSKHHTLVIGSRGIGKTHLLSLIQNRIAQQDDLADQVRIAWLREEEWGVASFLDFLYRILRALAARYGDEELSEQTEQLFSLALKTAERRAADLLRGFVQGKTLLLIAENLDSVFTGLSKKGQQRLRAYLQEESSWTILASSQALFGGVTLYDSPFYGFFDIHHLQELTVDDAARLVRNIAEIANDYELASYVQSEAGRARIRAVHHLAGGNHRVYMILSEFLTRDSLDQLVEPFLRMMDDLTPYYQARMEQLSPQQRKIIDLLCSVRGAVPVREIAKRCFISSQTASSQLKDLRDRGYVDSTPVGRDAYYELAEPLMRLALEVKNQRNGHVRLFLDFLRHWYARTELVDLLARTPAESVVEREYLREVLGAEHENGEDPNIQSLINDFYDVVEREKWSRALMIANELIQRRGGAGDWTLLAMCLMSRGANAEALAVLDRAQNLDNSYPAAWVVRSVTFLGSGRVDEALSAITTGINLDRGNPHYHGIKSSILQHLGRYAEAAQSLELALVLDSNSVERKLRYASLLNRAGRFEEAVKVFEDHFEPAQSDFRAFTDYVVALSELGRSASVIEILSPAGLTYWLKHEVDDERRLAFTTLLLTNLYSASFETDAARSQGLMIYNVYRENGYSGLLAAGLVSAAGVLVASAGTPSQRWITMWADFAGHDGNFALPLRWLDVMVQYEKTNDPRILLELPAEERRVVSELLSLKPEQGTDKLSQLSNVIRTVLNMVRANPNL